MLVKVLICLGGQSSDAAGVMLVCVCVCHLLWLFTGGSFSFDEIKWKWKAFKLMYSGRVEEEEEDDEGARQNEDGIKITLCQAR